MRGQVKIKQTKLAARRRKRALFLSLFLFFGMGIIVGGASLLSQFNPLLIDHIILEGNNRVTQQMAENIVLDKVSGNYGYLFSKRNTFIYPKDSIRDSMLAIPLIESAHVSRRGLKAVVVSVTEREVEAKWCAGDALDTSNCFLMDGNGLVFAPVDTMCSEVFCVSRGDQPAASTTRTGFVYRGLIDGEPVGQRYLAEDDFRKLQFFIRQIEGLSVAPKEAVFTNTGYVTLVLEAGGKLIINTADDLSLVLENIAAVISDKKIAPNFAQFLQNLDYIKLDSGNKVVYKLKG